MYRQYLQVEWVYNFLGAVNLFHGRIHDNQLHSGDAVLSLGSHDLAHGDEALGFVRPHELEIITETESREGIVASITRILAFGASVRVELNGFDDKLYEVELTRNQLQDLAIKTGQQVRLRPIQVRVFAKD